MWICGFRKHLLSWWRPTIRLNNCFYFFLLILFSIMQQLFLYATLMSEILIKSYIIEIGKNKFSRIKYTSIVKSARSWHWNSHEKSFCQSNKEIKQLYNSWVNRSNNVMMDYFPHKDCGLPQDLCVPICTIISACTQHSLSAHI